MQLKTISLFLLSLVFLSAERLNACTGISFRSADGAYTWARTIEWGGSELNSSYVIIPRGYKQTSFTPTGINGMNYTARYGVVGLAVEQPEIIADGVNEAGLAAGLFYFPNYGEYTDYNPAENDKTLADMQLVQWMLMRFATIDEVKAAIDSVRIVSVVPNGGTSQAIHWRITDATGRQVVLEITDGGKPTFYENRVGVLTNAPDFPWHITNLNNYVNLHPGNAPARQIGDLSLSSFGAGTGFWGLPGDITPPSRFVRAFFYQTTAPVAANAEASVLQAFHILNNFDLPIGVEFAEGEEIPNLPSATQWTCAVDITGRKIYYRTAYNSTIRCIDLNSIRFDKVKYQYHPLDANKHQPIKQITIR